MVINIDLKEFIEKKFECKIDLNDDDLYDFLYYYDIICYDKNEIKKELSEGLQVKDSVMDFVDIKRLSEYMNYVCVNDNLYIEGLDYFENMFNMEYDCNIDLMINDYIWWLKYV